MISQTGVHAIRAMIALGALPGGERAGAGAVAERVQAPPNYLGKLLHTLARQGLVASRKGVGGGFELARAASTISLYDILEPFEDVRRLHGCFLGGDECSDAVPCHVHAAWAPVRDAYTAFLRGTTLEDLARAGGMYRLEQFLRKE